MAAAGDKSLWYNSENYLIDLNNEDVIYINTEQIPRINVEVFENVLMIDDTKEDINGVHEEYKEYVYKPFTSRIGLMSHGESNDIITDIKKFPNDCLGLAEFITTGCPLGYDPEPARLREKSTKRVFGDVGGVEGDDINRDITDKSTTDIKEVKSGETMLIYREDGFVYSHDPSQNCPFHAAYVLFEDEYKISDNPDLDPIRKVVITIEANSGDNTLTTPQFQVYLRNPISRSTLSLIDNKIQKKVLHNIRPFKIKNASYYGKNAKCVILEKKGGKSRRRRRKSKSRRSRRRKSRRGRRRKSRRSRK